MSLQQKKKLRPLFSDFRTSQQIQKQIDNLLIKKERIELKLKTLSNNKKLAEDREQATLYSSKSSQSTTLSQHTTRQYRSTRSESSEYPTQSQHTTRQYVHNKRRLSSTQSLPPMQVSERLQRRKRFPTIKTFDVNIYSNITCPTEIKAGVKNYFNNKLKLTNQIDSHNYRCKDKHVFIICCERSRQVSDVEEVVEILIPRIAKKYCVLYLRHRERHTLKRDTSLNSNEVFKYDPYLTKFGSVIDCVYDDKYEIYDCKVNTKAETLIRAFLKEIEKMGTSPSKPETTNFKPLEREKHLDQETASESADNVADAGNRLLSKPWRNFGASTMDEQFRGELLTDIETIKPLLPISKMNVAIIGHRAAGKSSFINTIDSIFEEYKSEIAKTGESTSSKSITTTYRKYNISKDGFKHIWLCDTRGIDKDFGLTSLDFYHLLNGHIQDGYTFNDKKPIQPTHEKYLVNPTVDDQIHCVCFVLDGNNLKLNEVSFPIFKKFLENIKKKDDLRFVVLLTKMDQVCSDVSDDASNMYTSKKVQELVISVALKLGIDKGNIVPVVNYIDETETNAPIDTVALLALRQMLRRCKDFIRNATRK